MNRTQKVLLKSSIRYSQVIWPTLLGIILLSVYMATLLPGTGYQCDSAKFQFVGHVLGTPHPTGFPTYIFVNYFFTNLFPFGSLAYKANLLSALLSIAASIFLFLMFLKVFSVRKTVAFVTALSLGLTYTLWSQSIVAEVYTLNLLFLTSVLYFFLRWHQSGRNIDFYSGCALYAISFGNHLSMILILPAIVWLVWRTDKQTFFDIKKILWVLLFIILGALQYAYFFWRYYSPDTAYIEMAVPNLERFLFYISGAQYKSRMFSFSISQVFSDRIPWFIIQTLKECGLLIPAAIYGAVKLKKPAIHYFLLLAFLGNAVYAVNYNINEIFVYLIPNYLIIAIYAGAGLDVILNKIAAKWPGKKASVRTLAIFCIIPLFLLFYNLPKMHRFNSPRYADRVERILEIVKSDAVIISPDDYYSQFFWYYLIGEGWEKKNNIYLVHHFNIDEFDAYIRENKKVYLPEERKYLPPALKVYCIHPNHVKEFQKKGFELLRLRDYLHKVWKKVK